MIRVKRVQEPENFQADVYRPGMLFLASFLLQQKILNSKDWKNQDHWKHVKPALKAAFKSRCAYLAMRENGDGEVDHFICKSRDPFSAYKWENFRFANNEVNKKKSRLDHQDILDPFEIQTNWFKVDLVTGKLLVTELLPAKLKVKAENTIKRLGLNKKSYRETRLAYSDGCLSLLPSKDKLLLIERFAPLVALAIKDYWGNPAKG